MTKQDLIQNLMEIIEHAEVIKSHAEAETHAYYLHVDSEAISKANKLLEDIRCNIADELEA